MMWLGLITCFIALFINVIVAEDVGDFCEPTQYINGGRCVLITECEDALRYIRQKTRHPFKRCGFSEITEVVCCPPHSSPLTTKKPSTSPSDRSGSNNSQRITEKQCKNIVDNNLPPLNLHIIGGEDASLGEFPHMVALAYDTADGYDFKCGGSLISENYVLTAAHCIDNLEGVTPTVARLGVVDIAENKFNPESDIRIAEIIPHPEYNKLYKYHDMALLRLARAAEFSANLHPACLYTSNSIPETLTVTGWGRISTERDLRSKMLKKANVTAVARAECNDSYVRWRKLPAGIRYGQFCAGDALARTDACQGDSGGPIQASTARDGQYRIIGITSFGRGCGGNVPGVYTQVAAYLDWIESVVWPNSV